MVVTLTETSFATTSYSFEFFFWPVNYSNLVYNLLITFSKCQDTQTYIEGFISTVFCFLTIFVGQYIVGVESVNSTIFI